MPKENESDQVTSQQTSEGQTEKPSIDIDTAKEVLIKNGFHVLTKKQIEERIGKEKEGVTRLSEELAEFRKEYEDAKAQLSEYKNKGKTSEEIWTERQKEWQRREQEKQAAIEERDRALIAKTQEVKTIRRDLMLRSMLSDSADQDLAMLAVLKDFPSLSVNDRGEMTYTDEAGVEFAGSDVTKRLASWWEGKTILHKAPPNGPSIKKSNEPASKASLGDEPPYHLPIEEQLAWANRKNAEMQNRRN